MNIRNQQGGTLVEVIIAMFILALIIVGLNAGVLSLIKANISSKELSAATSSAYSLFEDLKMASYSSITTNQDTMSHKFIRAWTVTASSDTSQKTINISVYWPVSVQSHRITLSTIIARP
jgi:prepilin-type N-terminal cleavage/methylation domain-containing protein